MAERRCVLKEKTRMFEPDELIATVNVERSNDSAGADIWVPNPDKTRPFAILECRGRTQKIRSHSVPLYPVWGIRSESNDG